MARPIGNWPICHSIPVMYSTAWQNALPAVKQFATKIHGLGMYNLLQVAKAMLSENDGELRALCTDYELKVLKAYTHACTIKEGMNITVTWKSDVEGEPNSSHVCRVTSPCTEGKNITVDCDGVEYDICLYEDDVDADREMLKTQFEADYDDAAVAKVYMVDVVTKAFYTGYFDNEGNLQGPCTVEYYDGTVATGVCTNGAMSV